MKYIDKRFLIYALAAMSALPAVAQDFNEEKEDTTKVPVAFQKVNLNEVLGGVSVVDMKELTKKNYNTYALDNLQGYVAGWNGNQMWGQDDHLVLVDGVVRDVNNIKPEEIDKITFLKGAQAVVLYGSRAAKGAVLITTKRGSEGPLRINVRANTGWAVAKAFPEYLGSAEYMSLYNEACANDGVDPTYSAAEIYHSGEGTNPYRYPNLDFYSSKYVRKAYNRSDVGVEIEGGSDKAKYYANIAYYRQGDLLNFGQAKYDYVDRFDVRGNVDFRLNSWLSAYVNADVTFYNKRTPIDIDVDKDNNNTPDDYWKVATLVRPNRFSPLIPTSYLDPNAVAAWNLANGTDNIFDGSFLGGTTAETTNTFASYYAGGKNKYTSRQFQFDAGIDVDLAAVLKGLSFHTQVSVDYATSYNTSFNNTFATFSPTWSEYNGKESIVALQQHNKDKKSGIQNVGNSADNQVVNFNAHFDYENTFDNVHNFSAMLVANGFQQTKSGEYHRTSNANLGLKLAYNYDHTYFADFSAAAVHSSRLAEGHREAFSPSLSIGVDLAKFMDNSAFDNLMISGSASILNTDLGIDNYYMYSGNYTQNTNYWWGWRESVSMNPVISARGGNNDLTFLKRKELSLNVKGSLWKRMLTFDASFFTSELNGKITTPSNMYPNYFSTYWPEASFIPYLNYDNDTRTGFDFSVNYNKKFGEVDFHAGVNGTYYTTNASKRDDSNYADSYQYRQGKAIDGHWGYQCLGFFKDEADIANSPSQTALNGKIKPGDLKYKDQNGDNVIDSRDQVFLGRNGWSSATSQSMGDPFVLGMNFSASYKHFTLFVLATGRFGAYGMKNSSYYWSGSTNKYSAEVRNRWTPETASTATYPRLSQESGSNNFTNSDFWMYSTDQFNLAKVQLTYDFPSEWFNAGIVRGLSAYVSGSDLLKIAKNREILEMNVGSEPQTRFYNIGVKVNF